MKDALDGLRIPVVAVGFDHEDIRFQLIEVDDAGSFRHVSKGGAPASRPSRAKALLRRAVQPKDPARGACHVAVMRDPVLPTEEWVSDLFREMDMAVHLMPAAFVQKEIDRLPQGTPADAAAFASALLAAWLRSRRARNHAVPGIAANLQTVLKALAPEHPLERADLDRIASRWTRGDPSQKREGNDVALALKTAAILIEGAARSDGRFRKDLKEILRQGSSHLSGEAPLLGAGSDFGEAGPFTS